MKWMVMNIYGSNDGNKVLTASKEELFIKSKKGKED